jgi:hypothetical protein
MMKQQELPARVKMVVKLKPFQLMEVTVAVEVLTVFNPYR